MSRVPVGKVLLRNVIRHTGAHNKLQEETEMWKIREWEKQTEETYWKRQSRMLSDTSSSRMRSDGFDEEGHRADWKTRNPQFLDLVEDDLLRARSWNKKLYECEANMPDRWGHSGYKELYPEEFDTDSDQQEGDEKNVVNGKKRSHLGKQTARESHKRKKTKKSHKKKQKKRSHKKRKKKKKEQGRTSTDSSRVESEGSGEETPSTWKGKHKRKKKPRKVPAKEPTSSSGQESDFSHASSSSTSSSEDTESEGKKEKRPPKKRKKCPSSVPERQSEVPEKRSKRKNWKVAGDEKSEDSSDED
ncbi:uncharacterized protein NKAPD1 [Corvus kubaryi]|uniref:uncharacterized protein NKAPD1 n=1 Tax=Corvus kubaryi TaxID=68294 RepID=UPI001C03ED84|nr:uncharacterized protein NKAPD1 [Corvus kubaryi]